MTKPKAAISWSGGKDCCLAVLRASNSFDIVTMVTMFNEDGSRTRSHGLRPAMVAAQAARLELKEFSARCSWDTYTNEHIATLALLPECGITHVVFGDIVGDGHREWNERVCRAHRFTPIMPLWEQPRLNLSASSSPSGERPGS
jgi:diphthamide synthase (EF-2-diphthine--ammonia ligase)